MGSFNLSCFDISAISYDSGPSEDEFEENPEQENEYSCNEYCSAHLVGKVWASSEEDALEKAARLMGYQDSGCWLDFLNLGEECISLHVSLATDPDFDSYYANDILS